MRINNINDDGSLLNNLSSCNFSIFTYSRVYKYQGYIPYMLLFTHSRIDSLPFSCLSSFLEILLALLIFKFLISMLLNKPVGKFYLLNGILGDLLCLISSQIKEVELQLSASMEALSRLVIGFWFSNLFFALT